MDPLTSALLVALVPAVAVLVIWAFLRRDKSKPRKDLYFLLGFLAISLFYIFAPDPAIIYALYSTEGDTGPVWLFAVVAMLFLGVAVFIFKSYRRSS